MEQAKLLSFFDNFQATLDNINKNITEIRYRNELTDNSIKENLCQQNKINIDNTNKIDEISSNPLYANVAPEIQMRTALSQATSQDNICDALILF